MARTAVAGARPVRNPSRPLPARLWRRLKRRIRATPGRDLITTGVVATIALVVIAVVVVASVVTVI